MILIQAALCEYLLWLANVAAQAATTYIVFYLHACAFESCSLSQLLADAQVPEKGHVTLCSP